MRISLNFKRYEVVLYNITHLGRHNCLPIKIHTKASEFSVNTLDCSIRIERVTIFLQFCNCFNSNTVDFRPKIATLWRWHFFLSTFCRLVVRMTKIYLISLRRGFTLYQKCTKQLLAIKKDWELLFLNTNLFSMYNCTCT